MLTAATLPAAIRNLNKGERLTYHIGFLPRDKAISPKLVTPLARAAYRAYEDSLVLLVQRRIADFKYEYIMVRI